MAFGKDESNKAHLGGTFGQRAAYSGRRPERRGGEGGRSYWADNYKPSAILDTIRIVPAEYPTQEVDPVTGQLNDTTLPWYYVREHFHGGLQRGGLCSAGPFYMSKEKREPCYGCEIHWEDFAERKRIRDTTGQRVTNPNRMSMTDKYVFTIVDMATFFKTEQLDANGQVRTNQQGQPFMEWKKLTYPNDPAAAGRELKYGATLPWPMNRPQFDMLQLFNEANVGKSCAGCGTYGNSMTPAVTETAYVCSNCRRTVVDIATSTLTPLQRQELMKAPYTCQHCGVRAFMTELLQCFTCVQRGTEPRRASIFDVDIQVQMQKNPSDHTKQQLVILSYSNPRPIDPHYLHLYVPLDLPAKFKPTPLEEQRKLWKISEQVPGQQGQQGQPPPQHAQAPAGGQPGAPYGGYQMPQGFQPVAPLAGAPAGYPQPGYPPQGGYQPPQVQPAPQGYPQPGTYAPPGAAAPYQPVQGQVPMQPPAQQQPAPYQPYGQQPQQQQPQPQYQPPYQAYGPNGTPQG